MAITVDVNGVPIIYPQIGDIGWGDEGSDFAVQTSAALGKLGLASGTSVDIAQTLDVTGNTTLDANLSVGGDASVTGNTTLTGNITVNGNSNLGNGTSDTTAITGILNVDSGVLYVDPTTNKVGINDTTPSEALDVTGNALISGTLGVTGNSTLTGNLSVNGNTTLGDASGDSLTINGSAVSIPNGLNINSNTLVVDAGNNRVGIGNNNPQFPLDITSDGSAFALRLRGRSLDGVSLLQFANNTGATEYSRLIAFNDGSLVFSNGSAIINRFQIGGDGQLSAVVPGGSTLYPGYLCRAWVNFNGTLSNPITPRASGNISSITKHSTGDYTVNFTKEMPDANYCVNVTNQYNNTSAYTFGLIHQSAYAGGSIRVLSGDTIGNLRDLNTINVSVFR